MHSLYLISWIVILLSPLSLASQTMVSLENQSRYVRLTTESLLYDSSTHPQKVISKLKKGTQLLFDTCVNDYYRVIESGKVRFVKKKDSQVIILVDDKYFHFESPCRYSIPDPGPKPIRPKATPKTDK